MDLGVSKLVAGQGKANRAPAGHFLRTASMSGLSGDGGAGKC